MAALARFSASEAALVRELLRQRLHADREEQKRIRRQLRSLGFRISDFEVGLTPAGFDALVQTGDVAVGASQREVAAAVRQPASPSNVQVSPARSGAGLQRDVEMAAKHLACNGWSLAEAEASCPAKPGLYVLSPQASSDRGPRQVWGQLGLGSPPDGRPLYIGKAEDSLKGRDVADHFTGATGQSTVRRSLAALLQGPLNLRACPRNPANPGYYACYGLEPASEERLSAWMAGSLTLTVWPRDAGTTSRLRVIEQELIRRWQPPLNLTHATTPWTVMLKARRQAMANDARAWSLK